MPKQTLLFKILSWALFSILTAGLASACFFVRPKVLNRAEISQKKNLHETLRTVLPAFDNEPWNETFKIEGVEVYPARREEKISLPAELGLTAQESQTVMVSALKGFAFQMPVADGEGPASIWVGLDSEGNLTGFRPALQRAARVPENFTEKIALRTEASRRMTEAVEKGREFFEMRRNFFFAEAHQAQTAGETL